MSCLQVEVLPSDPWRCTDPCTYYVAVVGAPGDDTEYSVAATYYTSGMLTLDNGVPKVCWFGWRVARVPHLMHAPPCWLVSVTVGKHARQRRKTVCLHAPHRVP